MQLTIQTFGVSRDIVGFSTYYVEFQQPMRVYELRQVLYARFPALADLRSLAIAVNEEYAADDLLLQPTDEVVLIPPVSGG